MGGIMLGEGGIFSILFVSTGGAIGSETGYSVVIQ